MAAAQIAHLREELALNLVKLRRFQEIKKVIGQFMQIIEQTQTILNQKIGELSRGVQIMEYRLLLEQFFNCVNIAATETIQILLKLLNETDICQTQINTAKENLRGLDDSGHSTYTTNSDSE